MGRKRHERSGRTRSEVNDVVAQLEQLSALDGRKPDVVRSKRECLQRLMRYMTAGIDMSAAFIPATKCVALSKFDLPLKKMLYLYLRSAARQNAAVALLVVQTLLTDAKDADPTIRGLAIRSMCSLQVPDLLDNVFDAVAAGLQDRHPYVREVATMGVLKCFDQDATATRSRGLIATVQQLLGTDGDPQVLANCLYVLKHSSANATSMTLPRSIAINLLNNIRRFSDWAMCLVLEVLLAHYRPASESERFEVLDILDFGLNHTNSAVIMATAKIFLHYTAAYPDQLARVLESIRGPLQTLVLGREPEIAYAALANIVVLAHRHPTLWSTFGQLAADLFCRPEDPSYLKLLKLEALVAVANPSNAYDTIEEVEQYAKDADEAVVRAAVRSVARIALKVPGVEGTLDRVILLLERPPGSIVAEEAIVAVADVLRRRPATAEPEKTFIPAVSEIDVSFLKTDRAMVAYVWILGEYGHMIQDAPYVLEGMILGEEEEKEKEKEKFTSPVRLALLTAITKLFFQRPPECRKALGGALQQGMQDEDAMVRDRAVTYYALLADVGPQITKSIVQQAPGVAIAIDSQSPEVRDRIFDEWNSLSVIYNAPATSFISSSSAALPASAATDSSISGLAAGEDQDIQMHVVAGEDEDDEAKSTALLLDMDPSPGTANTLATNSTSGIGELEEAFQGLMGLEGSQQQGQEEQEEQEQEHDLFEQKPREANAPASVLGTGDLLGL